MNAPQLFSLALRLTGLIFLYFALAGLPGGIFKLLDHLVAFNLWAVIKVIVGIIWPFLMAWYFLRGAPFVQHLAYPNSARES